ncbi:MAG TPA: sulfurtransferase [Qipengyuania sp.]|nr:sulfurtransferase [Qipengyuania sp.]
MDSLISTAWLAQHLGDADLLILDASSHLPAAERDAATEFAAGHIPGARFLDLASFKDESSSVPSALPTGDQVAERLAELGYRPGQRIVIYDDSDVKTSARAWFALRRAGVGPLALLDGGLAKWRAEGRELATGDAHTNHDRPQHLTTSEARVRTKAQMLNNIASGAEQVIDARDAERFTGATIDTRHNLPGGHIPGSRHLFFRDLYNADGTFKGNDQLRDAFVGAKVDLDRPIVTTCGSGVTASVLLFALHRLGIEDGALYDGSWSEWGADPDTPKATGTA